MKQKPTSATENFTSLAQQLNIKSPDHLKLYHNLHCEEKDIIRGEKTMGKKIILPEDPDFYTKDKETNSESTSASQNENENSIIENENSDNEHKGKFFVIQKGTCQCNQGFKFPNFKVTSHQKHYWNSHKSDNDFLAVTEDDLEFNPKVEPFGKCKLKPSSGGYLPCAFAPAGKWLKTYDKVKVMEKSCLTEISELMCVTGGKITILKHGQQAELGKRNIGKANTQEQQILNPIIDFDQYREEIEKLDEPEAY